MKMLIKSDTGYFQIHESSENIGDNRNRSNELNCILGKKKRKHVLYFVETCKKAFPT